MAEISVRQGARPRAGNPGSSALATTGSPANRSCDRARTSSAAHRRARLQSKRLVRTDPSIADALPIDDDLIEALQTCAAPRKADIVQKINDSAQAFRASPPDYNASLVNARVAEETLASQIALDVASPGQPTFDPTKWGEVSVLGYLRKSGEITVEEEQGLAGVVRFLSPGAHRPVAIPEVQMARLGRSFALNMCWFLVQDRLQGRSTLAQPQPRETLGLAARNCAFLPVPDLRCGSSTCLFTMWESGSRGALVVLLAPGNHTPAKPGAFECEPLEAAGRGR